MSLKDTINSAIKEAMKAKEKEKLNALRAVKSAILLAETDKGSSGEVSEDVELKILQKLVKQRKESADLYNSQGRADLAEIEQSQAIIISEFLPAQMSEEDVEQAVINAISKTGASGPSDMGKVMGLLMKELSGKADGKLISSLVKKNLVG